MSKFNIFIIALCYFISDCVGQLVQNGQCDPNIQLAENFDLEKFVGTWYEVQRTDNAELNADCSAFEISNSNDVTNILHSGVYANFQNNVTGTASYSEAPSRLALNIGVFDGPKDFWVILTDDTNNFVVTYSCENISLSQRSIKLWILGKQRTYPNAMIPLFIDTTLNSLFGISLNSLKTVDHSAIACYILPVIQPGQSIILPGQCDPNMAVVQNFDVAAFTGTWHQIYSYFTESSIGSCARAQYSVGDGVVDVVNSQVINENRFTISGNASVASTDGSAKLKVILDVMNQALEQDLWILATDYTGYAISYSCTNVTTDTRRIYSWILGRSRELNETTQRLVDQVVDSTLELNYEYYLPTDQSDKGCFYYPEPSDTPVIFRGQCDPNVQAMQNFDPVRYMGLWHNIELYPALFQDGSCNNAFYTLIDGVVDVFNTQVVDETLDTITGSAVLASTDGSAKLLVTFPIAGTNLTITTDYWVLGTDYDSYALVYSCTNLSNEYRQVGSWKLSRSKTMNAASNTAINNIMNTVDVLDQRYFKTVDQSTEGCFYFPTPEAGVPVVFPGQCDNNINVVQNFDVSQFQGTWYEIVAYPKDEQSGQCINHTYTIANNNQLNLVSSSIVDQFLSETNGILSSTDGSGRLTITITSDGQLIQIPFWILNTDYVDYALAYACVNRGSDFRAVWSWKLSRTKVLSQQANTAINNAIANIVVLDNRYYETIDQSEQGCFYLPVLTPGEPVIIPGQCDTSITGMSNFDITRYAGRWRLIQSYASNFQTGTCNVARYTVRSATALNAVHSQVVDQSLRSISGTGTVSSANGNGILQFEFPSTNVEFPLFILDTDYDSYALAYGCQNVNNQQRRVWSWKLSRDNILSEAANININRIINSIDVLNERYYYTVDRTESGCFYYPEVDTSSSVRFRGQCNMSIPTVTNFDAVAYMGLWHDIESYPDPFQNGACNNAFYTLVDGKVDVFNTQVIDERLDTITGVAVVASTDGTAKLDVTFNVGGIDVTTKYWVLATDYTSYSLVYSCRAIDDEYVQVSSWKLSRTKALTAAANTAINTVMNTIPVLDQRYYVARDQSTTGCFYYPDPQPGVPVVFPGQCDENINTMQNFDLNLFQGTWYEIQAYPKDEQSGQCISHAYTIFDSTHLNLTSSSILEQIRTQTNGTITGTNGRLTITIISNNQRIDIPFWILNTDYTDYALAYACVNRGSDFRAVWSWKLSRSKQLSAAANVAINNAIANIEVLDNSYFENIDQSDQACFYLPELAPGEPVIFPGQCATTITGMANFNVNRYAGRWRLIQSYASNFQTGTCNVARYTVRSATALNAVHSQVIDQSLRSISGTGTVSSANGNGILQFEFPSTNEAFPLFILDTDYDSYALAYSCQNINNEQKRVWSWKLSRDNTLSEAANININRIINSIDVLNERYYYTVDRTESGCFYYPEVDTSSSVRFRGQCNMNIPTVTNFDAVGYMGLWHDIESYPDPFQNGACNNAFYTLVDGKVDVFNTQVIDERLDTITGVAVVASTDGTAKLDVTFNVGGIDVTTKYWVLATDYTSYSLVYSCRAIDDEYVQVSSWKLSRTKALTAAANTAINTVMNTIPVLDQRYYVARDQSTTGCFYYPDPQPGVPVVFPGQCDENISTMQNFDLNLFEGTWYEIQAYPKDEQSGQCVSHAYTIFDSTHLNLTSSSILDQIRTQTNGTITGTNGRLTITIVSNNQRIDIPFWILNTDYTDYALAYACVNRGSDFRAVWSWKLSRSKQLSSAANVAINNAIANIDVLDNSYFENIDQSDQACFYLPELAPGEPVIFPGQCATNITGIPNFNITRYAGRWRLVQSYGSNFQIGTCNVARYTVRDASSLNAVHSQVVDQSLRSISGTATNTTSNGTLVFSFPSAAENFQLVILDTDYDSYALAYGCENINSQQRRVWSWKLSRDNTLSQAANNIITQIVNSIDVLDERYYYNVNRTEAGCFYFPTPESNTTVRFRGQCNQNIPVVQNFDATRYMGLWHDIESYPMPFQFGTCPNAYYSLDGGIVNVFNTQVFNQQRDVIEGTAVVASTDGSAKLDVTFNVLGQDLTTNYWVLATDYDDYALVYSCENIDDEYMSIYSWKLSRTKTLTTTSIASITTVMDSLNILDQRYYVDRDQTANGCFYYPEPQPGVPVVFPGQCDNTITAIPNFSANQFAGLWYEIEAYPYSQSAQCINHRFALGSSSLLTLNSFGVYDEALFSASTLVNLTSTDSSGRLSINIPVNGTDQTIPFWVLATDYTDYALAYGCVNLNTDYRQIYSWKLSRTKQLSDAGYAAINYITSVDVINDRYYETVQQTDDSCFYLPVLSPTDPVTFPGQCDTNIRGISNFSPSRYLGRWRLIESYYSEFQLGTCNEATYSAGANGSVVVVNTEVVNQSLETIIGSAVVASTDGTGKLLVTFPFGAVAELYVLDTDYDSYSLVYSCANISPDRRQVWSWKLSRTNSLTSAANVAINSVVDRVNVLNDRYYQNIDRSDAACFYYPTPNDNTTVVFRGQCDTTITTVTNFDASRYLGFWYDLQSYPAPFQNGTCTNAMYTLNDDGSVRVENTQVVDQGLETWIGSAFVVSDDGTAKLNVTFNVNGVDVTTNYWVLATDYDTYAFVYSCENLDAESKAVFSWKLSRTPTLTAAADTTINNIINTIPVLDQRYYIQRSHTEEDCFYYPDNNGGDVILDGQCLDDSLVQAVPNFNANMFAGTWHEVSRFPSGLQDGECVATTFGLNVNNAIAITQTGVNNERLTNTTTQASLSSDGRGVINLNINGVPFNNVHILATDYSEYALAYSCRNIDNRQKQIYSWKLSRSRTGLSAAANTVIDQVVKDNIDLWERYYRPTEQDNDSCFYYPVFEQTPEVLELPGACPVNIRGMANFDSAAYLGRWFEIARYPVTAQRGQCNRADYSLVYVIGSPPRIMVSNSEVRDLTLATQIGFGDITSTDGRGELSVQFVVNGETRTANYYVLATDYTSYSLVYSCRNLDNGNRLVSSWKLSRTSTLSPQASAAINTVIGSTQGLLEEYYKPTDQSDDACFYIPSVNTQAAPQFRGQCEDITGVQGFDVQRYLGWWHEIERYPISTSAGECRSSEYQQDGNTYRVVDSRVQDNEGIYEPGTVLATSDGRLRRSMLGGGVEDIWVLATDYETYALLYSCENVEGGEYRRVWSAKHSKTRSLTQNAQNAMSSIIQSNRVLYDQFYLDVTQTDAACFHYPNITDGQVIIPGQCDSSIPVVQAFNVTNFAGTWYHTERYDAVGTSSCLGSRYTVNEAGEPISVVNFEVVDGELKTVEGSATVQSTDGSARISLTFPVADSEDATNTVSVSILATDYTSYAVVYNCVNVNAFQRQVRAWKLSRERTLSTASSISINALIQQRQELHQPYFNQIEQRGDCPEPSSAFIIKSSIIVLLMCAISQWLL